MILQVDSHAGPHGDLEPDAFLLGTRRLEVEHLIDRWITCDHSYFKLVASDDNLYILHFDQASSQWELTLFQSADP